MSELTAPTPSPTPEPDEVDKILSETRARYGLPDTGTPATATTPALIQVKSKPLESMGVEPTTDVSGMTGAVTRGLTVPASQALAGAVLGSPLGPPGMLAGAAAGPIVFGLGDLAIEGVNAYFGTDYQTSRGAITHLLDSLGTPKPDTAAERITEAVTEGLASGGGSAAAFSKAGQIAKAGTRLQKVAQFMGEKPVEQALIGGGASLASSATQELGGGPISSILAGFAGGSAVPILRHGVPVALKALSPIAETVVPSLKETKLFQGYKDVEAAERLQRIIQQSIPKDPAERAKVMDALSREDEFAKQGVKMMPGELTGYGPILAMQRVAEKTMPEVAKRKTENLKAIAENVNAAMKPIGAGTPKDTQAYFKSVLDNIEAETKNQIAKAKQAGQLESAQEMETAAVRAKEIKEQAEKGILTAEEAFNKTKEEYFNLYEKTKNTTEVTAKDAFSENAYNAILEQKNIEKEYLNKLGKAASVEVSPFYQENAIKSYDDLLSFAKGKERRIPQKINTIIKEAIDKKTKGIPSTVDDVIGDIQEINKEIRAATISPQRASEVPYFEKFKKSLSKDLEDQEGASENLKKFNRSYRDYVQIYKEGASKEIFKPGAFISKTLDEYIGKSEASGSPEEIQRLRKSIFGTGNVPAEEATVLKPEIVSGVADLPQQPYLMDKAKLPLSKQGELSVLQTQKYPESTKQEAIKNVAAWVVGRMSSEISDKAATKSINNWMTTKGNRILKVFPEVQPLIDDIKSQFKTIEDQKDSAQQAILKAKNEGITAGQDAKLLEKQAKIESEKINSKYNNQVNQLKEDLDYKLKSELNQANKFFGANVPNLISDIMSKPSYSETNMSNLIQLAKKDPTGKAYEGLVNGFKQYLNRAVRNKSKQLDDLGIPALELPVQKLRVEIDLMNQLMSPDSPQRNIIEMMLGKGSQELAEMDQARQMLETMSRQTELKGTNVEKLIGKTESQLANDLFSIAGIGVGGFKGFVVFKSLDLIRKLQARTRVDVGERMLKMYADAMLDNKQFKALATPITEESFPMVQQLLRQYGIVARATDFGLSEPKKEEKEKNPPQSFQNSNGANSNH